MTEVVKRKEVFGTLKYDRETDKVTIKPNKKYKEYVEGRINHLSAPTYVGFALSYKCNLKCRHCYSNAGSKISNELSTEECFNVIDQLAKMKVFQVGFTGGEPLMKENVLDIIEYACSKKVFNVFIPTNGTLLTDRMAKALKNRGVYLVRISLDGINPATHEKFRGVRGSWKSTMNALKILKKYKIRIQLSTCVNRDNLNELDGIYNLGKKLGIHHYSIFRPMFLGRTDKNIMLTKSQYETLLKFVEKHPDVEYDDSVIVPLGKAENKLRFLGCAAARSQMGITADGFIIPCPLFKECNNVLNFEDNVRDKPIVDVWNNAKLFKGIRSIKHISGKCGGCKYLNLCGGGCRASAIFSSKSIYGPDLSCPLAD